MKSIRAISLDLDGTLWNVFPTLAHAEATVYEHIEQHFPRITEHYSVEELAQKRETLFYELPEIRHDFTKLREILFSRILTECGYDNSHTPTLLAMFMAERNNVDLFPDVVPALRKLSQHYPIVSFTDGNSDVHEIGIGEYFVEHVNAVMIGTLKPDTKGFFTVCDLVGSEPAETLHIGDHPEYDMLGARNAGMQTMWIKRDIATAYAWNQDFSPDYCVRTLDEAVQLLC